MLKLSPPAPAVMGIFCLVLWFRSGMNTAKPMTLLFGVGMIAFSIYLQQRKGRPVTISPAVPWVILAALVVLAAVFQVATGVFMLSSWLFIGLVSVICYTAYLRGKNRPDGVES